MGITQVQGFWPYVPGILRAGVGAACKITIARIILLKQPAVALMFKRIDHVAIHVSDLDRSVAFYERHFGFTDYFRQTATAGLQIAYLRLGDTVLELTHHFDGAVTGFHFCLETDSFDATVEQLLKDGVKLVRPPHATAAREPREKGWRRVVFAGPDGEQIELRG
jgi:lactoylglutathione lyase